ncbi:hypothetical protein TNCV_3997481 [Trichonephila clavipes]|nr:hypothetical protein TNCV_3997481 [Trichonephila clavipes]
MDWQKELHEKTERLHREKYPERRTGLPYIVMCASQFVTLFFEYCMGVMVCLHVAKQKNTTSKKPSKAPPQGLTIFCKSDPKAHSERSARQPVEGMRGSEGGKERVADHQLSFRQKK